MGNQVKKVILLILIISVSKAQWGHESAAVIDKGRKEIGLFSPFKMVFKMVQS